MLAFLLALQLTAAAPVPTVFVFTTTDCPISNRYAPEIKRLSEKFAGKARFVLVYAVATDTDALIREHIRKFGYTNEWRHDPAQTLVRHPGVKVTPEVAIVDDRMNVLYRGRIDDRFVDFGRDRPQPTVRDLERSLDALIAGKPVPVARTQAIGCILSELVK
jgi:thiol-disulfide isomerase/thioredoxin